MNCVPTGCLFFPLPVHSSRHVARSATPIKAQVVKPGAPRVSRKGASIAIEPLWNRVINAFLGQLPARFIEKKVAGCMDSLIDVMVHSKDCERMQMACKKIEDIDALTVGLDCDAIFHEQIRSKVQALSRKDFDICFTIINQCCTTHPENTYLALMKSHFKKCAENYQRIQKFFGRCFKISKEEFSEEFVIPNKLLSLPAQTYGFPEDCAALKSLAKDIVDGMTEREVEYLAKSNVDAYDGIHKDWAGLCLEAARERIIKKENALKIERAIFNGEKKYVADKIGGSLKSIIKNMGSLASSESEGTCFSVVRPKTGVQSLIMQLAQKINCLETTGNDIVKAAIKGIVHSDVELKKILHARACDKSCSGKSWREQIKSDIDALSETAVRNGAKPFDFNPTKISNPLEPKTLVDMIFDTASE